MTQKSTEDTLNAWLEDERVYYERVRRAQKKYSIEDVRFWSGIDILNSIVNGESEQPEMARTLNYLLLYVAPGKSMFQATPDKKFLNPLGTVHGGWFATLLDSALGCAIHTLLPEKKTYTTAEFSVKLIRGIPLELPRLRAEGIALHCGRKLATSEARLFGPDGKLYAHATSTCLVLESS